MSIKEKCIKSRLEGKSTRLIAEEIGVSQSTVFFHTKGIKTEIKKKRQWSWSKKRYENIGSVQRGMLPNQIKHSSELAYFYGIYLGDGCYSGKKFILSCGDSHPHLQEKWINAFKDVMKVEPHVRPINNVKQSEIYIYEFKNEKGKIGELLNIKNGNKTHTCKVPEWILENKEFCKNCVLGLMESDGHVVHCFHKGGWYWQSKLTSVSSELRLGFKKMLEKLGINGEEKENTVVMNTKDTLRLLEIIGLEKTLEYVYDKPD